MAIKVIQWATGTVGIHAVRPSRPIPTWSWWGCGCIPTARRAATPASSAVAHPSG
jgi:hypothetical protein